MDWVGGPGAGAGAGADSNLDLGQVGPQQAAKKAKCGASDMSCCV